MNMVYHAPDFLKHWRHVIFFTMTIHLVTDFWWLYCHHNKVNLPQTTFLYIVCFNSGQSRPMPRSSLYPNFLYSKQKALRTWLNFRQYIVVFHNVKWTVTIKLQLLSVSIYCSKINALSTTAHRMAIV